MKKGGNHERGLFTRMAPENLIKDWQEKISVSSEQINDECEKYGELSHSSNWSAARQVLSQLSSQHLCFMGIDVACYFCRQATE
jgi:hypothetical protein